MAHFKEADRIYGVPLSKIREMADLSRKKMEEGKPVIHLEIGEPDFDTPKHIDEAAVKALEEGKTHYGPIVGTMKLREAIAADYKKRYGLEYSPEDEVIVTHGVTHGIFLSMMCFLNPGDEILVPDPGYLCYTAVPQICQAKYVPYGLDTEHKYQIIPGSLDSLITPRTKAILLNTPSNPCGFTLNETSLNEVARIAKQYDLFVISDEVYSGIVYDDTHFSTIASLPGMKERTIILNGFSKYYAMTGWRIGYILCDRQFWDPMMRMSFYNISCPNLFVQSAAVTALQSEDTPSKKMVAEYQRRRDFLYDAINKINGLSCQKPDGAFYMLVDIRKTGMSSDEFCKYILNDCYVTMTPGIAFGEASEGFARISYATSMENLQEAVRRIEGSVKKLFAEKAN